MFNIYVFPADGRQKQGLIHIWCTQLVGKLFIALVPLLIAFGVGVGVFAAATYNEGVDAYVKP